MLAVVIYSVHANGMFDYIYGVATIDRKNPTMYCVREAVSLWLVNHLHAEDITFEWGTQTVNFTAGGATPYASKLKYKSVENFVHLGERDSKPAEVHVK